MVFLLSGILLCIVLAMIIFSVYYLSPIIAALMWFATSLSWYSNPDSLTLILAAFAIGYTLLAYHLFDSIRDKYEDYKYEREEERIRKSILKKLK